MDLRINILVFTGLEERVLEAADLCAGDAGPECGKADGLGTLNLELVSSLFGANCTEAQCRKLLGGLSPVVVSI